MGQRFHEALQEIERLREQVRVFHEDWKDLLIVTMYGNPPGGWSDPERIARFQRELAAAEARHRAYDEGDA